MRISSGIPCALALGLTLLTPVTLADAPEQAFAWTWPLNADASQPLWRVNLPPAVIEQLHRAAADDLLIVDARGQPVPFARLAASALIQDLQEIRELAHRSSRLALPDADSQGNALDLTLDQGDTRLVLRAPRRLSDPDVRGQPVFEALIAGPEEPASLASQELVLVLESERVPALDCRVRDADDSGPAVKRLRLGEPEDSRPIRTSGRVTVESLPRAWHLLCYGRHPAPESLTLVQARLESRGKLDHAELAWLQPALSANEDDPGHFEFELAGPMQVRRIRLTSSQPNLLSDLVIESRNSLDQAWRNRGQLVFSTLEQRLPVEYGLTGAEHRDRWWRIRSDPALPRALELEVAVRVEQLVFLAQGEGPWRLMGGSLSPGPMQSDERILASGRDRLGAVWDWPLLEPGERSLAGGPEVLIEPDEPLPWRQIVLWVVLSGSAALVVWLAAGLLRNPN